MLLNSRLIFSLFFNILIFNFSEGSLRDLEPRVKNGTYNEPITLEINNNTQYVIEYSEKFQDEKHHILPARVTVSSNESKSETPIIIVVREKKGVLSWQLPLVVETKADTVFEFKKSSRTLCPHDRYFSQEDIMRRSNGALTLYNNSPLVQSALSGTMEPGPIVEISTASVTNLNVTVLVEHEEMFYINMSQKYNITVSPSEPKYFFYDFTNKSLTNYKSVLLEVMSDDDICMMISIQNYSCPVFDLEREIQFEGYWETINRQGGITLTERKFPYGFFVVFVVKGNDYDCIGSEMGNSTIESRNKTVQFVVTPNISYNNYFNAVIATGCVVGFFYVVFLFILLYCARKYYRPMTIEHLDQSSPGPSVQPINNDVMSPEHDDSSIDETDFDTVADADIEKDVFRSNSKLTVADLARKDPRILKKKSNLYLWHVLIVAIFYGIPVIQLVVRYQSALNETGNQDLCYYNFLCAHPYGFLSDFNHVFSNIGYVALGILFLILVYRRQRMHQDNDFEKSYGIPQHYGLFYAMGCGLIMEGILSGSYHVCPNHYNFQFDSSFMYVMAVLSMIKIYQTRHPDINARANATFGVLAAAIFLGMVGILDGSIYFWSIFVVIHIVTCLLLTAQIYYMGRWKLDCGVFRRVYVAFHHDYHAGVIHMFTPMYKGRWFLLAIGNICNLAISILGLLNHDRDFATFLLAIFMGNTVLYTTFYIIMKLCHKEKLQAHTCVFIFLAFLTWGASLYFFINKSISWALTPAQSRQYNHHCILLGFYDGHDVWHFLSAIAMFFSFMMLLTLDDDLAYTHRSAIAVF